MVAQRMKPRTPEQQEAFAKRQLVWKHNSFTGHARMGQMHMMEIIRSETATDKAKAVAQEILTLQSSLSEALKERR